MERFAIKTSYRRTELPLICTICESKGRFTDREVEVLKLESFGRVKQTGERRLAEHMESHGRDAPETFICVKPDDYPKCFKIFGTKIDYETHVRSEHQ